MIKNKFPCWIICILICSFSVSAQQPQPKAEIDPGEILSNKKIKVNEATNLLIDIYTNTPEKDTEGKYTTAKFIAQSYFRASDMKATLEWHEKVDSLQLLIEEGPYDKNFELHKIALKYTNKQAEESLGLLKEMEVALQGSRDSSWIIQWHILSAKVNNQIEDKAAALKHLLRAEEINEEYEDKTLAALLLDVRGAIYEEESKMSKALEYYIRAQDILEEEGDINNLPSIYSNIHALYMSMGDTDKAIETADKLSRIHKVRGCETCYFTMELNKIFFHIQDGNYSLAIEQAQKTIDYAELNGRDPSHAIYLMGIAYRGLDDYGKASALIRRAFDLGIELKHNGKCSFYSHALYQTYYWKENYADALEWFKVHTTYRDSVYNEKKAKEITVYESKLDALEKQRKLEELESRMLINKQQKKILWISIVLGSMLAISLLYAQNQKSKRERLKQDSLLLQSKLEREYLTQQLEFKEREIATQLVNMGKKNSLLKTLKESLSEIKTEKNNVSIERMLRIINSSLESNEDWDQFLNAFKSIHSSFIEKLGKISKGLNSSELRLASLLKMNLSSKEIASILNISYEGVKKARYRLRKKLEINSDSNVQDFLLQL